VRSHAPAARDEPNVERRGFEYKVWYLVNQSTPIPIKFIVKHASQSDAYNMHNSQKGVLQPGTFCVSRGSTNASGRLPIGAEAGGSSDATSPKRKTTLSKLTQKIMLSIEQSYANTLKHRFGEYRPIWLPTTGVAPGDILLLNRSGSLERVDSLFTYPPSKNLPVKVKQGTANVPIDFVSTSSVTVNNKLSGGTNVNLPNVPQANVGISIVFKNEGDFIMYADGATESSIDNLIELEDPLDKLLHSHEWEERFIIAARVLSTSIFTLLIAQTSNCKVEFSLDGTLTPSLRELGKAGVTVNTVSSTGNYLKFIGATNLTPLVVGVRLVLDVFRPNRVFHPV
jgi:hypothetical protein